MGHSALIGEKPLTQDDYWIIKGMYRAAYDFTADPSEGYLLMPSAPAGYVYHDKKAGIVVGMVVAMVIMLFFTVTRLSLRFFRANLISGFDDLILIPGAILAIVYPILQIVMVTNGGGGKHVWDVTYEEYNVFNALGVFCKIIFFTTVGIIKISIAFFIRRMGVADRGWRIANDILIFLLVGYTLLALFWTCFQCKPPPAMWDKIYSGKLPEPATCWSTELIATALSVIHVVMDFILLATPMIILWKVQLSKTKKVRLYLVFSVGALSCVASVIRQLAQKNIDMDITYGYTTLLAWTVVDLTLAVMVASLPVLSALLPLVFSRLTGSSGAYNTGPLQGASTIITSGIRSARRQSRKSQGSDEGGILREHEIELTYAQYKSKAASKLGIHKYKNSKEASSSWATIDEEAGSA